MLSNNRPDSSYPNAQSRKETPIHDAIQIGLSIANEEILIDLLEKCSPPLLSPGKNKKWNPSYSGREYNFNRYKPREIRQEEIETLISIRSETEVPVGRSKESVDGLIYWSYEQPIFQGTEERPRRTLIEIKTEIQSFGKVLAQINRYRNKVSCDSVILVCSNISELEAQGFISQNISVYPAGRLLTPLQADCSICINSKCALYGNNRSPVIVCSSFDSAGPGDQLPPPGKDVPC